MPEQERDDAITDILKRVKGLERAVDGLVRDVATTARAVHELHNSRLFVEMMKKLDNIRAKTDKLP